MFADAFHLLQTVFLSFLFSSLKQKNEGCSFPSAHIHYLEKQIRDVMETRDGVTETLQRWEKVVTETHDGEHLI